MTCATYATKIREVHAYVYIHVYQKIYLLNYNKSEFITIDYPTAPKYNHLNSLEIASLRNIIKNSSALHLHRKQ